MFTDGSDVFIALIFIPSVEAFTNPEQDRDFKPDLSRMYETLQCCTAAELLEQLSEELNGADIIGQYEVYVRAAPWKRFPATLVLKHFCAILTVRAFHCVGFTSN